MLNLKAFFLRSINPPIVLGLVSPAVISEVSEDMPLLLVNNGLLDPSEAIYLESVLSKCPSLIKHHHVNSPSYINPLWRYAENFSFPKTTDCERCACSHGRGKSGRHRDSDEIEAPVNDISSVPALVQHIFEGRCKTYQCYDSHTKHEFQRVLIELELAWFGIQDVSDKVALSSHESCPDNETQNGLGRSETAGLNDLGTSIESILLVLLGIVDVFDTWDRVLNDRDGFTGQHAFVDDAGTREQCEVARHATVLRDLNDVTGNKVSRVNLSEVFLVTFSHDLDATVVVSHFLNVLKVANCVSERLSSRSD